MKGSEKLLAAGILAVLLGGYALPVQAASTEISGQTIVINNGQSEKAIIEGLIDTIQMNGNSITINKGGSSTSNIIAAWNDKDGSNTKADGNSVTIYGDTAAFERYVAGADVTGDATNNSVTLHDATVMGEVIGGQSHDGDAKNNKVVITGDSSFAYFVYGGSTPYNSNGNSENNRVEISGGTYDFYVAGGTAHYGSSNGNTLNITGANLHGWAAGGVTDSGTANNNTVNISGNTKVGSGGMYVNVYGGQSSGNTANGNKVNISGGEINYNIINLRNS